MKFDDFLEQLSQAVDQLEEHYQDNPFITEIKHPSEAQRKAVKEASKAFNHYASQKDNTLVVISPEFDTLIREGKEKHLKVFEIAPSSFTEEDFDTFYKAWKQFPNYYVTKKLFYGVSKQAPNHIVLKDENGKPSLKSELSMFNEKQLFTKEETEAITDSLLEIEWKPVQL
jgi:hypothetical protein